MVLSKECVHRIANDVKYIIKNPLTSENIYYKHDENEILKGYALIIGNPDTPYSYGYYFFEFNFPEKYPFQPPIVRFYTNDGRMRFNPNLYISGKVCLSVLNTWKGEGWTSCQNITSILITLSAVLNDNPLLNEPGIREDNPSINSYNLLLNYKNIEFSILKQISILFQLESELSGSDKSIEDFTGHHLFLLLFKDIMCNNFKKNKDLIKNKIESLKNDIENNTQLCVNTYNLNFELSYEKIMKKFNKYINLIN